jgi:hypothetical protein
VEQRETRPDRTRLVRILACVLILAVIANLLAVFVVDEKPLRIASSLFESLCAFAFAWAVWPGRREPLTVPTSGR